MSDQKLTIGNTPAATSVNSTDRIWIWQYGQLRSVSIADIMNISLAKGSVTLQPSATSTIVTSPSCISTSHIILNPQTARAASGITTTYAVAGSGMFTIHHASNVYTDRSYLFEVISSSNVFITLQANATTTTIVDDLCGANSHVSLTPRTYHAANSATGMYALTYDGYFVIHHPSNSYTDKDFSYEIF
jgi:hypothetical protein